MSQRQRTEVSGLHWVGGERLSCAREIPLPDFAVRSGMTAGVGGLAHRGIGRPRHWLWLLKILAQFADKFSQGGLVAAVPHPLSQLLCLDQPRFCQNRHMMGDRQLRKLNCAARDPKLLDHITTDGTAHARRRTHRIQRRVGIGDGDTACAIQGLLKGRSAAAKIFKSESMVIV